VKGIEKKVFFEAYVCSLKHDILLPKALKLEFITAKMIMYVTLPSPLSVDVI
jgi:hypothetical protein